jgi:hypothetical protein
MAGSCALVNRYSSPRPAAPSAIEHDAAGIPPPFTGWHYFLAQVLQKTRSRGLDVHCFVKLGSLPIEADVIILHLDPHAELALFSKYFSFLVPCLRPYLVIEYKGPDDRLTLADFDTVRAYAMLCKRKYQVARDQDVAVAMLYSHAQADLFARCADNGFPFEQTQVGLRQSCQQALGYYAVDLVAVGEQQPDHPINLLSARRRNFAEDGQIRGLGPFAVLYEEVFLKEVKKMSQTQVPGSQELLEDAERLDEFLISRASVKRRLAGIAPEELVRHLSPAERLKLRELLLKSEGP